LVPDLKQAGHRVNFQEFDGPTPCLPRSRAEPSNGF
jgi:hypothetical protein